MTENIAKDTQKPPKAGIAFAAVVVGGPFVYLGLMLIVLYRPEVMTWLGLEPFVAYLIEHQPAGYENLVQQNSPAFADYFFHFHAASLLAVGIINSLFVISMLACLNILPKIDRDFLNFLNSVSDINIKYFRAIVFTVALVLIFGGWFLISMPAQMDLNTKFSPNNSGIGYSIFMWAAFSFFFKGLQWLLVWIVCTITGRSLEVGWLTNGNQISKLNIEQNNSIGSIEHVRRWRKQWR